MDFWTKSAQLWWLLTFEPEDGFSNFKKVNWSEFRALSIGIITWICLDPNPDPLKCLYLDQDPPPKKFGSKTLVHTLSEISKFRQKRVGNPPLNQQKVHPWKKLIHVQFGSNFQDKLRPINEKGWRWKFFHTPSEILKFRQKGKARNPPPNQPKSHPCLIWLKLVG